MLVLTALYALLVATDVETAQTVGPLFACVLVAFEACSTTRQRRSTDRSERNGG